jgi:hypothetical protein
MQCSGEPMGRLRAKACGSPGRDGPITSSRMRAVSLGPSVTWNQTVATMSGNVDGSRPASSSCASSRARLVAYCRGPPWWPEAIQPSAVAAVARNRLVDPQPAHQICGGGDADSGEVGGGRSRADAGDDRSGVHRGQGRQCLGVMIDLLRRDGRRRTSRTPPST